MDGDQSKEDKLQSTDANEENIEVESFSQCPIKFLMLLTKIIVMSDITGD